MRKAVSPRTVRPKPAKRVNYIRGFRGGIRL